MLVRKPSILVATPFPLFPATDGGRIDILGSLQPVAADCELHLLAMMSRAERDAHLRERGALLARYYEVFRSVHLVDRPQIPGELKGKGRTLAHLISHARLGLPLMDVSYYSPSAVAIAAAIIRKHHIDILEIHHLHMAFLRRFFRRPKAILVNHNLENELWPFWEPPRNSRLAALVWSAFGKLSRRNARRIELQNRWRFDAKLFVSTREMEKADGSCRKALLPTGVVLDETPKTFSPDSCRILWMGGFGWPPNREGMEWFLREVLPRLRDRLRSPFSVQVVGADPSDEIRRYHCADGVVVHGFLADVAEQWRQADIFVVPLLSGAGIRVKIVEAMNRGVPVVSTSKGCEGMPLSANRDLLVADTADDFAAAIERLAADLGARRELSEHGRQYVREHHASERIREIKRSVYAELLA